MIEIRNLQFQPLTFNLAGDRTLHLGPRERTSIPQKDISPEITLAEKRGLVCLSKPEEKQPSASDETAAGNFYKQNFTMLPETMTKQLGLKV